jgi:cytochrome c553
MKLMMPLAMILATAQSLYAADIEAGKRLASTVCAACHGISGVSVSDTVPNLAGQRAPYVEAQLISLRTAHAKNRARSVEPRS